LSQGAVFLSRLMPISPSGPGFIERVHGRALHRLRDYTAFPFFATYVYPRLVKPFFDVLTAAIAIVVLSPLMILVAIALATSLGGSPFFLQPRVGYREKIFYVIKFRTMNNRTDSQGRLLPDEVRLTALGRWVRKTSLDELPQLLNVLSGNMSFVGPRPLLVEYLNLYSAEQRTRHLVKPGISGWAQINGRNAISWKEKFALDVWYTKHQSFWLDLKIVFITIFKILKAEGISGEGVVTAVKFNGSN
jgi:undecaprenyl phosphate N,N'-diacetylbacillosamine 1-phosphate transferase